MSLAVLYLYICCIILVSQFNWLCRVFNVKVNNLAFDTSKKYHKCMVVYEDLDKQSYNVYMVYFSSSSLYPVRFVTFSESNQTQ